MTPDASVEQVKPVLPGFRGREPCPDHQRACNICSVDYKGVRQNLGTDYNCYSDDNYHAFLRTGANRFIPQLDEELELVNTYGVFSSIYSNLPKPDTPDTLRLNYCSHCSLTWLEGKVGSEAEASSELEGALEPSQMLTHKVLSASPRSVVVFFNGSPSRIGVFFGPRSSYNVSMGLGNGSACDADTAQLRAALEALRQVRQRVEPDRLALLKESLPEDSWKKLRRFRLIAATDSRYVVESLCKRMAKWNRVNNTKTKTLTTYRDKRHGQLKDGEDFAMITREVEALSKVGIKVVWYRVPKEYNRAVDRCERGSRSICS
ncbi:hypothetical protein F4818DRAFT_454600 [Hypoxylon cercidicola]|nr:hypothetical protein F4818DRAFT_454600 [Hypoxylon cercidicola]